MNSDLVGFLLGLSEPGTIAVVAGIIESELLQRWPWFKALPDATAKRLIVALLAIGVAIFGAVIATQLSGGMVPTEDVIWKAIEAGLTILGSAAVWHSWVHK